MAVGLLALLDDIATILDDVSILTKVAAKKTAGVLGDDLALNAQQVSGVNADRELPVVFAVFKGSLINKLILVPAAIAISAFIPWLITPLLMIGGAYLCFEGAEKVLHRLFGGKHDKTEAEKPTPVVVDEKQKIKGAVRTDFILSAEIIVIALGTVPDDATLLTRALVLAVIAFGMTAGVYGLVAGIVKLDDAGLFLNKKYPAGFGKLLGGFLLGLSPKLMRALGILGTIAMFMVGGGILAHGLPFLHGVIAAVAALPVAGLWNSGLNIAIGLAVGGALVGLSVPMSKAYARLRTSVTSQN